MLILPRVQEIFLLLCDDSPAAIVPSEPVSRERCPARTKGERNRKGAPQNLKKVLRQFLLSRRDFITQPSVATRTCRAEVGRRRDEWLRWEFDTHWKLPCK